MNDEHWSYDGTSDGTWLNAPNLNAGLEAMSEAMHGVGTSASNAADSMDRLQGLGQAASRDFRVEHPTESNGVLECYRAALAEATRMDVELEIEDSIDERGNLVTRARMKTRRGDVVAVIEPMQDERSLPIVWRAAFVKLGLLD